MAFARLWHRTKKIMWRNVITNGKEMLSIFLFFDEYFCKISFTLDAFGVYDFLVYS